MLRRLATRKADVLTAIKMLKRRYKLQLHQAGFQPHELDLAPRKADVFLRSGLLPLAPGELLAKRGAGNAGNRCWKF